MNTRISNWMVDYCHDVKVSKNIQNTLDGGWFYKKTTTRIVNSYILGDRKAAHTKHFDFMKAINLKMLCYTNF